jgi:hypothetical protein
MGADQSVWVGWVELQGGLILGFPSLQAEEEVGFPLSRE